MPKLAQIFLIRLLEDILKKDSMSKIVYWAPWDSPDYYSKRFLGYSEPVNVFSDVLKNINKDNKMDNFFALNQSHFLLFLPAKSDFVPRKGVVEFLRATETYLKILYR